MVLPLTFLYLMHIATVKQTVLCHNWKTVLIDLHCLHPCKDKVWTKQLRLELSLWHHWTNSHRQWFTQSGHSHSGQHSLVGSFRNHGFGFGFGLRLHALVWSPERVSERKARSHFKQPAINWLAWAEFKAEAIISTKGHSACISILYFSLLPLIPLHLHCLPYRNQQSHYLVRIHSMSLKRTIVWLELQISFLKSYSMMLGWTMLFLSSVNRERSVNRPLSRCSHLEFFPIISM